eukprot:scaffold3371_cov32-Tisochrysis_lutea.AAC.1
MPPSKRPKRSDQADGTLEPPSARLGALPKATTILQRIMHALRTLGRPSSAQAIVRAVAEAGYTDSARVRRAIKQALGSGALQTSPESVAKFWIAGELPPAVEAPPTVVIDEVADGKGDLVQLGDEVVINYELFLAEGGQRVETGKKFEFQVGAGDVIKGMDAGVLGMKLGGRRKVTVPWMLGYGKRGSAPSIPSCANLIFKIKLTNLKKG